MGMAPHIVKYEEFRLRKTAYISPMNIMKTAKKSASYTLKDRYNYRNRQTMSGLRMEISEDGKMVQYDSYELYLVK